MYVRVKVWSMLVLWTFWKVVLNDLTPDRMSISRGPKHIFDTNGTFVEHSPIVIYITLASDMHWTNIQMVRSLEFPIIHNTSDHHNHLTFDFHRTLSFVTALQQLFHHNSMKLCSHTCIKGTFDRSTRNKLFLSRHLFYFLVAY